MRPGSLPSQILSLSTGIWFSNLCVTVRFFEYRSDLIQDVDIKNICRQNQSYQNSEELSCLKASDLDLDFNVRKIMIRLDCPNVWPREYDVYLGSHQNWKKPGYFNLICPGAEVAWNLPPKVWQPGQNNKFSRRHG